jgi:hypothetical protein
MNRSAAIRVLGILIFTVCAVSVWSARRAQSGHFLVFATWDQAFMGIGKYEPGKGWISYQDFYDPPQPGDAFTIYTMAGEVAQVTNTDTSVPGFRGTSVEWAAHISPWYREGSGEPYALAVLGRSPLAADPARVLPLEDPDLVARVSSYLRKRKLDVPHPHLTQAFEVTLSSGGPRAVLVCAHSDASARRDDQPAAVYAVALLQVAQDGIWKDFPLAQQTSFKPAFRSIEEHERLYGRRDFYRFLSCLDINGDGRKEIVLYTAQEDFATQIDVFTFDGRRVKCRLTAFKHLYN